MPSAPFMPYLSTLFCRRLIYISTVALILLSILILTVQAGGPVGPTDACSIDWYDEDGYVENRWDADCRPNLEQCPYGRAGNIITGETWCSEEGEGGPPAPPNIPALTVGAQCMGGTERTVVADTSEGDSQQIRRHPDMMQVNNPFTFTDMQEGIDYRFEVKAEGPGGSSGWGNLSPIVQHDQSSPTTTADFVGTAGDNDWWRSAVSVALLATDAGCLGVEKINYTLDGVVTTYAGTPFTVSGDGEHSLSYEATDSSNVETTQSASIHIDTVAPVLEMMPDRLPDTGDGWYTRSLNVILRSSDATSGIAALDYNWNGTGWQTYHAPIALTDEGIQRIDGRTQDNAGWDAVAGIEIRIDLVAPHSELQINGTQQATGWYSGVVELVLTAEDAVSGVVQRWIEIDGGGWQAYTTPITVTTEGTHQVQYYAVDQAGHLETVQTATFQIDNTPPHSQLQINGVQGANGWYGAPIALVLTAEDAVSGVAQGWIEIDGGDWQAYTAPITVTTRGAHRVRYYAVDQAGHQEAVQTATFHIDDTPPILSNISAECEAGTDARPYVQFRGYAQDGESGLMSATLRAARAGMADVVFEGDDGYTFNGSFARESIAFYYLLDQRVPHDFEIVVMDQAGNIARIETHCDLSEPATSGSLVLRAITPTVLSPTPQPTQTQPPVPSPVNAVSVSEQSATPVSSPTTMTVTPTATASETAIAASIPLAASTVASPIAITGMRLHPLPARAQQANTTVTAARPPQSRPTDDGFTQALAALGLLVTSTAGIAGQMTASARERRRKLDAKYAKEQQQLKDGITTQQHRAHENTQQNAQQRAAAQKVIHLEGYQSEANKRFKSRMKALQDARNSAIGNWLKGIRIHRENEGTRLHNAGQAAGTQANAAAEKAGEWRQKAAEASSRQEARQYLEEAEKYDNEAIQQFQIAHENFQQAANLFEITAVNAKNTAISRNAEVDSGSAIQQMQDIGQSSRQQIERYWDNVAYQQQQQRLAQQRQQEAAEAKRRQQAIAAMGEANGGYLQAGWANQSADRLEQEARTILPREIERLSGKRPDVANIEFTTLFEQYEEAKIEHRTRQQQQSVSQQTLNTKVTHDSPPFSLVQGKMPGGGSPYVVHSGVLSEDPVYASQKPPTDNKEEQADTVLTSKPGLFNQVTQSVGTLIEKTGEATQNAFLQGMGNLIKNPREATQALQWVANNVVENPRQTLQAISKGIDLNLNYSVDLTANENGEITNWTAWSPQQIHEAHEATGQTADSLYSLINRSVNLPSTHTPAIVFQEFVGSTTIQLDDVEHDRPDTIWLPEADGNLIRLPRDFQNTDKYGELGRWMITGEFGKALDHHSFGTVSQYLYLSGNQHRGETTSGLDEFNKMRWIYDEQGMFDFSAIGGPKGAKRLTYDNDEIQIELADMFKQRVFFEQYLKNGKFDSSDELIESLRMHERFLPGPDTMLLSSIVPNTPFPDDWTIADYLNSYNYLQKTTLPQNGFNPYNKDNPDPTIERIDDIVARYEEHVGRFETFLNRNANMDQWLASAYIVSTMWRDPQFQANVANDNYLAHQNITRDLFESDRFRWIKEPTNVVPLLVETYLQDDILKNVSQNVEDYNPTSLYQQNQRQNRYLLQLAASTDWANNKVPCKLSQIAVINGVTCTPNWFDHQIPGSVAYDVASGAETIKTLQANLPPEVIAASNYLLSQSIQSDFDNLEYLDKLQQSVNTHLATYAESNNDGYSRVNPATVTNHNVRAAVFLGIMAGSILIEPLGDAIDIVSATGNILSGNFAGAAVDMAGVIGPHALKLAGDAFQTGKRALDNTVDAARQAENYAENIITKIDDTVDAAGRRVKSYFDDDMIPAHAGAYGDDQISILQATDNSELDDDMLDWMFDPDRDNVIEDDFDIDNPLAGHGFIVHENIVVTLQTPSGSIDITIPSQSKGGNKCPDFAESFGGSLAQSGSLAPGQATIVEITSNESILVNGTRVTDRTEDTTLHVHFYVRYENPDGSVLIFDNNNPNGIPQSDYVIQAGDNSNGRNLNLDNNTTEQDITKFVRGT